MRLSKNVKLLQGGGKFQIRALRTDEEKRRFRGPPDYPPTGPSGSLDSELEDDLELPMLRGSNRRCVNFHLKLLLQKPLQGHETHLVIEKNSHCRIQGKVSGVKTKWSYFVM